MELVTLLLSEGAEASLQTQVGFPIPASDSYLVLGRSPGGYVNPFLLNAFYCDVLLSTSDSPFRLGVSQLQLQIQPPLLLL